MSGKSGHNNIEHKSFFHYLIFYSGHRKRLLRIVRNIPICTFLDVWMLDANIFIMPSFQFLYISQSTFSIGVFPIVRWKYISSILWEFTVRRRGSIRSRRPNRAIWVRNCDFVCWDNITYKKNKAFKLKTWKNTSARKLWYVVIISWSYVCTLVLFTK